MKKHLIALLAFAVLTGCEEASKAIEKAQTVANQAVDSAQEKMETVNLDNLNLEVLGDTAASATKLADSVQEALTADFSDPEALHKVQEHISNAYACLVDVSSDTTAENLLNQVMQNVTNEEAKSLIEKGVEKAKEVKACVL